MSADKICLLGREPLDEGCFGDDCGTCGWNREVEEIRRRAAREGLLFPNENGKRRLILKDGWPLGLIRR